MIINNKHTIILYFIETGNKFGNAWKTTITLYMYIETYKIFSNHLS